MTRRPLLINKKSLAFELSISTTRIDQLRSAKAIPAPIAQQLTNRALWKTEQVERWIEWGMPDEESFNQLERELERNEKGHR